MVRTLCLALAAAFGLTSAAFAAEPTEAGSTANRKSHFTRRAAPGRNLPVKRGGKRNTKSNAGEGSGPTRGGRGHGRGLHTQHNLGSASRAGSGQ